MERSSSSPAPDRQLREELEHLQVELRGARAALESANLAAGPLQAAIEEARARRDLAAARLASLVGERESLTLGVVALEARLVAQKKEADVLAVGAARLARGDAAFDWPHRGAAIDLVVKLVVVAIAFLHRRAGDSTVNELHDEVARTRAALAALRAQVEAARAQDVEARAATLLELQQQTVELERKADALDLALEPLRDRERVALARLAGEPGPG